MRRVSGLLENQVEGARDDGAHDANRLPQRVAEHHAIQRYGLTLIRNNNIRQTYLFCKQNK